jgi:hypothetical protein
MEPVYKVGQVWKSLRAYYYIVKIINETKYCYTVSEDGYFIYPGEFINLTKPTEIKLDSKILQMFFISLFTDEVII